jgi:cell division protein FtsQ
VYILKINRLKKRHKKPTIPDILKKSAVILSLLGFAVVAYLVIHSLQTITFFPVKEIRFTGNRHLTDEELRLLSGVHVQTSLLSLSGTAVSRQLLKSPWIRSVNVRKQFPETLSFVIEEAEPFALLDMKGHLFLVDEKGTLLEELKDNPIPFLPVVEGDPFQQKGGFTEALRLAKVMNDKGFTAERDQIEIIADRPEELTVMIDGTCVRIGTGDYEQKLERFMTLEEEVKNRGIPVEYIDLRFANKAVVKPITDMVVQ